MHIFSKENTSFRKRESERGNRSFCPSLYCGQYTQICSLRQYNRPVLVRGFILTEEEREIIRDYLENLPDRMPGRVRRMRHSLYRSDLDEMESDVKLLRILKELEVPIGRAKGEGWRDQRGKFDVHGAESEEKIC